MNEAYLEVTYRHGRPLAAYYYLPRPTDARAYRLPRSGGFAHRLHKRRTCYRDRNNCAVLTLPGGDEPRPSRARTETNQAGRTLAASRCVGTPELDTNRMQRTAEPPRKSRHFRLTTEAVSDRGRREGGCAGLSYMLYFEPGRPTKWHVQGGEERALGRSAGRSGDYVNALSSRRQE
jgi:hypothetical protein